MLRKVAVLLSVAVAMLVIDVRRDAGQPAQSLSQLQHQRRQLRLDAVGAATPGAVVARHVAARGRAVVPTAINWVQL